MKLVNVFFLVFTVSLCIASIFLFTGIILAKQAGYSSALEAHKLLNAPEKFVVLENPDQYVIRALSNPDTAVFVDLDKTLIDNILPSNDTNNVFFENSYYEIHVLVSEPGWIGYLGPLVVTWIIWGIVASVMLIFRFRTSSRLNSTRLP